MFYTYFTEIKNRIFLVVNSCVLTMLICYVYKKILLFLLVKINFKLYKLKVFYFITTNLTEVFSVCLQLISFVSFQLTTLLAIYHLVAFLTPGLFKFEYKILKLIINLCCLLCCFSIIFLHVYILPFLFDFFFKFMYSCGINIFFESKITEYFSFYKDVYFLTVLISQILAVILINLLLINNKINFVHKYRKIVYLSFILISTLTTPPDVVSQIIVSITFISIYEIIVLFVLTNKYLMII